jgi:hypothetical protein
MSAVVITGFVIAGLVSLSFGHGVLSARLLVAEGVIGGLGVMTAATLLSTIGLRTWAPDTDLYPHTVSAHPAEEAVCVGETAAV